MQSFIVPSCYELERELISRQEKQYQERTLRIFGENVTGITLHTGTIKRMSLIKNSGDKTLVKRKIK